MDSNDVRDEWKRRIGLAGLCTLVLMIAALPAAAQVGRLISPGPLTRAHEKLEGISNCDKCHEKGNRVSADRCLACHKPIAERMAAHKGVHRDVTGECENCHVEHMGRDAELRPFETKNFDHQAETGFALTGKHASLAAKCDSCHKTRSFLGLSSACASCHQDPHKGRLGNRCEQCHSVNVGFKETGKSFDHSKTAFPLVGGHQRVACEKCHQNQVFKGLKFASCTDCHTNPHKARLGTNCSSCHTPVSWKVENFDHSKTGAPLLGKHRTVACAKCHQKPATEVRLSMKPCAACHADPHKGNFGGKDCSACHNESGFGNAPFDHQARTKFALEGKHATLECTACHKQPRGRTARTLDFRGLKTACVACHSDPHGGQFGQACEQCHTAATFRVTTFEHPRFPAFYAGQHAKVTCEQCHRTGTRGTPGPKTPAVATRVYKGLSTDCVTCHKDVHLGQLGSKCESCHSVDAEKFAPNGFDHQATGFPLTGKHLTVTCHDCHKKETGAFPAGSGTAVRLKGLSSQCAACHKDPHLGQVGSDCRSCHDTTQFAIRTYQHRGLKGFFRGKHLTAACGDCHRKVEMDFPAGHGVAVQLSGLGGSCTSCHTDPHGGQLGAACDTCHSPEAAWKSASRAFHKAGLFPLEGRHLITPCADCHWNGVIKGTPTACYDCHWIRRQDDKYQTRLGNQCELCHRPTSWAATNWDHTARTGFALSGVHRTLACDQCHRDANFAGTPTGCVDCHREDYDRAEDPNHVKAGFPTTCENCHRPSDSSWNQARFDHATFPLAGVHASQPCTACHQNDVYAGTSRNCVGCHQADFDGSLNPNHAAAGFASSCDDCHRFADSSWSQGQYSHTVWPLQGLHADQTCVTCHGSGVYQGLANSCVSCHQSDYDQSQNPPHASVGFPLACEGCHNPTDTSWQQGRFDHATFPLAGVHLSQPCDACHQNGVYAGTARTCVGCHQSVYDSSRNPNHVAAMFPATCDSCHRFSDTSWQQGTYDHATFPLAGVHATRPCNACHQNDVFAGTARTCYGCHQSNFEQAADPNHVTAGFPTTCDTCHKYTDTSWNQGVFDHSTFALLGVHATQTCNGCHQNGVFAGTPRTCYGCHQSNFEQAADPNHLTAGFPTSCDTCHQYTDTSWNQGVFDHSTFALLGAHATETCNGCHQNGVFAGTPRTCYGCHQPDFEQAADPNHLTAGFPTTCDTCHKYSDTNWNQAVFDHSTFALLGVHATQTCSACHQNGVYAGTARTCYGCHQTNYDQATDPNHVAAGFATTCDDCHRYTDTSWDQFVFNHSSFTLAGVHASQTCNACHRNDVFAGTPRTCYGCHQTKYEQTTDPNHITAGFPTTCDDCHKFTDSSWTQGVFDHSTFPLAGVHLTQPCDACHRNGVYAGTPRTCYGCHQTKYEQTTDPNHITAGFPTTCDDCHKFSDSSWTQGVFDHSTFPLAGVHLTQPCDACHRNGVYAGTPRTCYGCHQTKYEQTRDPNHIAAGFPTSCETCHRFSDARWEQGVFNHTWFPITSGRHSGNPCSACHTDPNNYMVFSCTTGCHSRSETDGHHREVSGYTYDSAACYSCHPQGRGD